MSSEIQPLDPLFHWLQTLIVSPDGPEAALRSPEALAHMHVAPDQVGDVVVPSRTLSPIERIGVYASMYPLRMREALETDYPCVKHFLGCEAWHALVDAYVQVHPSRHPNLNVLGAHMPAYLRTRKDLPQHAFLAELADLELAMTQVFDAPETSPANVDDLAAVPGEAWAGMVFKPVPALRLHAFNYPVNAYLQAVKDDRETPPIRRAQTYTVVYRKSFVVWRMGLTRPQYRLLRLLLDGQPVGQALLRTAKGSDAAAMARDLRAWFGEWVGEGFFASIASA